MSWFFIAISAPILWAVINYIDKYIVSKKELGLSIEGLVTFSWLFGIAIPILILIFGVDVSKISNLDKLLLILSGCASSLAVYFYFRALVKAEASVVIPLMQLVPIFSIVVGVVFFKEILTYVQIVAVFLIILGAVILSINTGARDKKYSYLSVIILMIISSILFTVQQSLFKFVTSEAGFFISSFWQYIGMFIVGLVCLAIPKFRQDFFLIFKNNYKTLIKLNVIVELLNILANLAVSFALTLAPLSMVMLVSSYQPAFAFIIGTILTLFFPRVVSEDLSKLAIFKKTIAISLVIAGSFLIYTK